MLGKSQILVANLSSACFNQKEKRIVYSRCVGFESGATLIQKIDNEYSNKKRTRKRFLRCV